MDEQGNKAKSLVCEACWNGLFSFDAWQIVLAGTEQPGRVGYSNGYCYTTTWESLHASSAAGCSWCKFLCHPEYTNGGVEIWVACDEDSECTPAGTKKLTVKLESSGGRAFSLQHYYMYTTDGTGDHAGRFIAARERVVDIASPTGYRLALECLDSCTRFHESCPKPQPTTLPDRVIDCSNPEKPRIVITNGKLQEPQQTVATTQNIDEYVNHGIDISHFPKTIREAIEATHGLGDSIQDRNRQIGKMRQIYRNSFATIVAACGKNVHEGFLRQNRPQKVPDAKVPFICPDGTVGSVWIAAEFDTTTGDATRTYYDELEPMNFRGWCLQERLLSPRCLIYASHTLQLWCQHETVNVGQALCEPSNGLRLPSSVWLSEEHGQSVSPSDGETSRQAWLNVIFDYTLRKLSISGDKLVAIAAVAEQFNHVWNSQYLAGLWQHTLLLDLLWYNTGLFELNPRPGIYRAPSWSWASIDDHVVAQSFEDRFEPGAYDLAECDILGCKVTPASADVPFGQVSSGTLILEGHLKEATLQYTKSDQKSGNTLVQLDMDGVSEVVSVGWARMDALEEKSNIWIIPMLWDKGGEFMEGLIVTAAGEGYFRRVGHFTNHYGSKDITWVSSAPKQIITLI
ncbi:hypothetical protein FPQ18DRAFT_303685 [Pyronema domesticum]|nr:hypothetical protein FPQ18DRAFT_303685 [Pyronema domesticum]